MTNAEPAGANGLDHIFDVLIVGGGLGGLALAVGLGHLPGLNWLLVEAADELRTATGTLIGVGANGLHALECLDPRIVENVKKYAQVGTRAEGHVRPADPAGEPEVNAMPLSQQLHTIRWGATQRVLAELVEPSRVRCGHKCRGYTVDEAAGHVAVHFKDKPDIKARLVIGADGVRSVIRSSMCPSDPGPRFLGYMNWNAVRHVPGSSSAAGSDVIKTIRDSKTDFSVMVYIINAGCDYQFWQVRMTSASPCFTNGGSGGGGVPGSKARVMQRLQQLGWQDIMQEVEATDESAIYERAMWDRLPLPAWSAAGGHVVLLGDAAHAMYSGPGQGARTAFEDAHQMFLAIKQHWPNPAAIAAQYEEARVHRASIIQNYAAGMANLAGLSSDINAFWQQLHPDTPDADGRTERFREFQLWLNSYPEKMHGLPGSKYTSPEALKAFVEHCAAATAQHSASQQHMPSSKISCA
ncbi:hypothetical protein OEZ86_011320 [Tetradesmus obliquus]|nr:hypothetical protein OEZ86_011320 [Tetradesmus obliquus]